MSSWGQKINLNRKLYSVMLLSSLGILISLFLALVVEKESVLGCTITGTPLDCAKVLTTEFSTFLGIPVSILSTLWFIVLLSIYIVNYQNDIIIAFLSILGLGSILYFIFLELFVIQYICLYCTIGHILGVIIILILGSTAIINSYEILNIQIKKFYN